MQQRATGWTSTLDHCSKDIASIHGSRTQQTELLGCLIAVNSNLSREVYCTANRFLFAV